MNVRVITISGEICTGKSSTTNALLQRLNGWRQSSTGQMLRDFCSNKGISIQQVSFVADEIHREFDLMQRSIAETESKLILEGRLTGWLTREIPHVFRVYCFAPLEIRVKRYVQREGSTEAQAESDIEYRDTRDVLLFRKMYNVNDYRDPSFYSLVIDTSRYNPREIADIILSKSELVTHET